jgi:hypothetical protein
MEWISVKDRLPEDGETVIVSDNVFGKDFSSVAWCAIGGINFMDNDEGVYWADVGTNEVFGADVTHWMPLPDPPRGNE